MNNNVALSLYNKYRPQTFKDVVGQDHVEKTLANAVEKNKVSHAYLFCGPRGTGKTTTARILAKALLCDKAPTAEPDGTCEHCHEISEGVHPDVYELDAASRTGVDNVREEIIGRVSFAPTHGTYKIYIIDEVHMLSTAAFNALLKTLEEPPSHVVFVLCTTDVHKVPDTVQARCQRFDFKHLSADEIVGRLRYICEREGFDNEQAALELIAQRSQGGMRDAIRSLEQAAVFTGGQITYTAAESLLGMVDAEQLFLLCDNLASGDAAACFDWVAGYVQSGSDIAILVNDLAVHIRNLYAVQVSHSSDEHLINALEIESSSLPRLREQALCFGAPDRLAWMLTVLGSLSAELKNAANARLALEVALTRILRPESELSLEALAVRVAELEAQLAGEAQPGKNAQRVQLAEKASAMEKGAAGEVLEKAIVEQQPQTSREEEKQPEPQTTTPAPTAEPTASADEQALKQESRPEAGNNQALHRQWNSVVDAIKKEKRGVAANLGGVAPRLNKEGNRLTLELPAGATTSRQYLETDANKALLNKVVAEVFGTPLEITLTVAPATAGGPPAETAAFTPGPAPDDPVTEPGLKTHKGDDDHLKSPETNDALPISESERAPEPSKEELDNMLSTSTGSQIRFEEQ